MNMGHVRQTRAVRVAAGAAAVALLAAGCTNALRTKPEAADMVLLLGEDTVAELEGAGLGQVDLVEVVDDRCEDDEAVLFRMVARYVVAVEPEDAEDAFATMSELWTDGNGYELMDDGVYWGASGLAVLRAEGDDALYSATLHPDRTAITVSISTECFEDIDDGAWFDPIRVSPAPAADAEG
jgi:hypothetical protein